MLFMILAASLIFFNLDRLLMETDNSSSALIKCRAVLFLLFLFSQIRANPVASRDTEGRMNDSPAESSCLRAFSSETERSLGLDAP